MGYFLLSFDWTAMKMAGQGYKRTNFEEDDYASNGGTPPPIDVVFRGPSAGLSSWRHRTTQEKCLLLVSVLLVLVIVVLAIVLAFKDSEIQDLKLENEKYCMTPECVKIASTILTAMDTQIDPCEDFYQFACGGWMKNNPIPPGHSRWGTFELMWQKNMLVMKNAIDKPASWFNSSAELKAKQYYISCMDENKLIDKAGGQPLLDLIHRLNWGVNISEWNVDWQLPQHWDMTPHLGDMHLLNIAAFMNLYVAEDDKDSSVNILQIDQGGLQLPDRDYYLNKSITDNKVLSAYLKYMVEVFQLLGAPNETFTRESMIDVILLETEIANITTPNEERRDENKIYHRYDIANLTKSFNQINWVHIINHVLSIVNLTVLPTEQIVVYAPEFLAKLNDILATYQSTESGKKILFNYMLWHIVNDFVGLLSKPFRDAKKEFTESMSGLTGNDDIWHTCITDTDSVLGYALGALFVKETFSGESKAKVTAKKMIEDVRKAFIANLPKLDWMDPVTMQAAIDKANAVIDMIGYPDYIMDEVKLDKKYESLIINESDYFGNNLAANNYSIKQNLEKLRKKPINEWGMSPPTVNAYYTTNKNTIVFPAGILQAPFFDRSFPQSLNYGAMGVVMGHELTHGFDDQGRQFDKNGNLKPWWDAEAVLRFKNKTQCMVDQYSSYQLNGEKERGKQTLGENIADNGGLKSAFYAYQKWVELNGKEQLLPALGLSHEKLFFLSFAQVWCWNSKPESDHLQVLTDAHSPAKFRVIGPLSNSPDFSRIWKCSDKSKMNPKKKCEVW
ncbi:endothelin-converting enzyme homolog isoform X3 [Biomphalaria glabrata]|uniref:Endothelin-converting enzyme homolog isoform X3 n=1 Tax=Biomphalaria glabrata TaxID=6526 RepID=A0A9W2YQC0_BIOGL|nr:endothelin-converting enzyme homolog isoform X3 [Biomphalaria glabrata]